MAKLKAEVLHQHYQNRPLPLEPPLAGPDLPPEPDRGRDRPADQLGARAALRSNGSWKRPPASTAGERSRRSHTQPLPQVVSRSPGRSRAGDAGSGRAARRLLHHLQHTRSGHRGGAGAGSGGLSGRAGGPGVLRPAGDLQGAASPRPRPGAATTSQKLVAYARRGIPIVGCEPSCLVTLVDEYREFRLGPDAELVATPALMVDAFVADPANVPDLPLQPLDGPRAGSWPLPAKGGGGHGGYACRPAPGARARGQGARLGLLRHGRLVWLRARPLRGEHRPGQPRLLPALRPTPTARLVAPGFSCRSQVHGLAGIEACIRSRSLPSSLTGWGRASIPATGTLVTSW